MALSQWVQFALGISARLRLRPRRCGCFLWVLRITMMNEEQYLNVSIVILECLLIEYFISQKEDQNENSLFTLDALQIHAKSVPVIPMNTCWGDISIIIVLHMCHCFEKCGDGIMKYRIPPADQGYLNICGENLL